MDELAKHRAAINIIDEKIITLLGQRYAICRKVGKYKKVHHIAVVQRDRVDEVKDRCASFAVQQQIDPDFIRELYSLIIDEACQIEHDIIENPGSDINNN